MKIVSLFLLLSLILFYQFALADEYPPLGSIPFRNLKAYFALYDSQDKLIVPASIKYDRGEVSIAEYPEKKVEIYFKVDQGNNGEEGCLLSKIKRTYKVAVQKTARNKVRIRYSEGFYEKQGTIINVKWNKMKEEKKARFGLDLYRNFTQSKPAEGIEKHLSVFWAPNPNTDVLMKKLREHFEFSDYSKSDISLFTCNLIHFLDFKGVSWIKIQLPVADIRGNLEEIFIEIIQVRGEKIIEAERYWLKEVQ